MYFMKREANFTIHEIHDMLPFEMDIFYNMCVKDLKDRLQEKERALRK